MASRLSARRRLVGNSGSPGWPARSRIRAATTFAVERVSGVDRCFRPLPVQRMWAPLPSRTSWQASPHRSETRIPVWMATVSSAWSRRPFQWS
jgi:hypothetical protein